MTIDQIIEVTAAFKAGKKIQYNSRGKWYDDPCPTWNFSGVRYRVKPEPREWWLNVYNSGVSVCSTVCSTEDAANAYSASYRIECVHVREVLE